MRKLIFILALFLAAGCLSEEEQKVLNNYEHLIDSLNIELQKELRKPNFDPQKVKELKEKLNTARKEYYYITIIGK